MQAFSALLDRLVLTPQRNGKLRVLTRYLQATPDPDRGYALAAVTGDLSFSAAKAGTLRALVTTRMDEQLFALSYDYVGDLAETIALVWPTRPGANRAPTLGEVVETLSAATRPQAAAHIERWLDALDSTGRWGLLKLVTGGLRVGVSARLAKQALADMGGVDVNEIEEVWHAQAPPYEALFAWMEGRADRPSARAAGAFRPVMLAHPLDEDDLATLPPTDFAAEWKWDGIRVQVCVQGDVRRLYTRTGDDISGTFPDVLNALSFDGVLDGELLVRAADGQVAPFNDLQQRLNRKSVDAKLMTAFPAFVRAYDILAEAEDDLRPLPFSARRQRLERLVGTETTDRLDLSPLVPFSDWPELAQLRADPPEMAAEGLMLKRLDSVYEPGRPKGPWFKWKREPQLVDCVLMYAQRGHGKRSSFYSDFTFGAWRGEELVPVGKAYFGFTDAELKLLDRYVRDNTVEKFGPVRSVAASREQGLVLEIAFEGLARSNRHKSGVAMRFPRIHRIRWDKPPAEADRLEHLERLLPGKA